MPIKEDVHFAVDSIVAGTGSAADPYRGPDTNSSWFDPIISDVTKVGPNTTVRLGPGLFLTRGNNHSTSGWSIRNGMRITGAGVSATTLRLVDVAPNEHRAAIGMNFASSGIDGFEASDFTIDCAFPGSSIPANSGNTAVAVFGRHIRLRRLRVINYGTNRTGVRIGVINAGSAGTEDSVVDDCTIEPGATGAAPIGTPNSFVLILFGGQSRNPTRNCVVRNCVCRGVIPSGSPPANPVPNNIHGICPGAALGFIAENNQLLNLASGLYDVDISSGNSAIASETTRDVVFRNNYMRYVFAGVNFSRSWTVNRIIVHDNSIDVATGPGTSGLPTGVNLQWAVANPNRYASVIIRENIIRSAKWDTGSPESTSGINVNQVTDLNIENNLINDATTGASGNSIILGSSVTNVKLTNNRTSAGVLVRPDT